MRLPPSLPPTNPLDIFERWSERRVGRKPLHVVGPKPVTLAQLSLRLYRLLELLGNLERLLTICVLRCDPALPAIFITETSCPKLRFRMSPNARHPITKLITSSSIQAFPRRLTLSESSRTKPAGHSDKKQGFEPPRIQVTDHESLT